MLQTDFQTLVFHKVFVSFALLLFNNRKLKYFLKNKHAESLLIFENLNITHYLVNSFCLWSDRVNPLRSCMCTRVCVCVCARACLCLCELCLCCIFYLFECIALSRALTVSQAPVSRCRSRLCHSHHIARQALNGYFLRGLIMLLPPFYFCCQGQGAFSQVIMN